MSAAGRLPLILMRIGGLTVAAGVALAYLAWALSYARVDLAAIAVPVGVGLLAGVLSFVLGAVLSGRRRADPQSPACPDPACRR